MHVYVFFLLFLHHDFESLCCITLLRFSSWVGDPRSQELKIPAFAVVFPAALIFFLPHKIFGRLPPEMNWLYLNLCCSPGCWEITMVFLLFCSNLVRILRENTFLAEGRDMHLSWRWQLGGEISFAICSRSFPVSSLFSASTHRRPPWGAGSSSPLCWRLCPGWILEQPLYVSKFFLFLLLTVF